MKITDLERVIALQEERAKLKEIMNCKQVVVGTNITNNVVQFIEDENPDSYNAVMSIIGKSMASLESQLALLGVDCE